jgi:hypothetical protein
MRKLSPKTSSQFLAHPVIRKLIKSPFALAASVCLATGARAAISVGPSGVGPITFDTQPTADEWSTIIVNGDSAGVSSLATLDATVQTVPAGIVNVQLAAGTGNPPVSAPTAQWASDGHYLVTRPTSVLGAVIVATLQNDSGEDKSSITVSYNLTVVAPVTEEVPGLVVYYSLTGTPASWKQITALSSGASDNTAGRYAKSAAVNVGSWTKGSTLYLLWADDNGAGSPDAALEMDDFAISFAPPPLPTLKLDRIATGLRVTFTGTLQSADSVAGPYTDVVPAASPLDISFSAKAKFYRAKR